MGVTPSIQNNTPLQPVSSGPYKIVRLKKEGPVIKEAVLQEMETSYRIGKLSFRYYEDEDQVITAQKLGEIEGFTSNKEHSWPNINKTVFFQRGIYYSLIFNLKNKDLTKEVRKKLLIATPEKQISEELGLLANGPISESQFTSTKLKFDIHDPSVTDTLNINLKVVVPQGKEYEFITDLLGQSWKKLGVSIQVMKLSSDEIENEIIPQRDFDVLLYGQEVSRDPDRYPFWHSTRIQAPGLNISGFENIRADRALEEGRNVVPEEERIKHYEIFQESMLDYTPAIFLYHPKFYLYTNKRVKVLEEPKTYYTSDIFNSFRNWDVN